MSVRAWKWAAPGLALVVLALVGLAIWLPTGRKPAPPPAPPAPPPEWECGTAYGAEVCERTLPPARPAP